MTTDVEKMNDEQTQRDLQIHPPKNFWTDSESIHSLTWSLYAPPHTDMTASQYRHVTSHTVSLGTRAPQCPPSD